MVFLSCVVPFCLAIWRLLATSDRSLKTMSSRCAFETVRWFALLNTVVNPHTQIGEVRLGTLVVNSQTRLNKSKLQGTEGGKQQVLV